MVDASVIIIGAGPAGLTAARVLEQTGTDYLLISKEGKPGESKACGGFVPQRAFREFGLQPFPSCHEIRIVRMKFPRMKMVRVDFERPVGYTMTRSELGEYLLRLVGTKNGRVLLNTQATLVHINSSQCEVKCVAEDNRRVYTSELVIDCSGVIPVSTKTKVVREKLPEHLMGYAVQYQMRLPRKAKPFGPAIDFYYGSEYSPHGYAWNFPRERETAVGTGGLISEVKSSGRRTIEYLEHLIHETEPLRSELADAKIVKREAALMPLSGIVKPSFSDRIMLAGDAAGHCSPITGEGIYYSIVGGKIAGEIASMAIKARDFSKSKLKHYQAQWISAIGADLKWGLWLQRRLIKKGSSELGGVLLRSEKNIRIIAEMLVGERSVKNAILALLPSYLRSKIFGGE